MSERLIEVLDQIEAEQQRPPLPDNITALPLLQMAYRGQVQLTPQQMRAAIEALPFEVPKLSATAITSMDEKCFAAALDRAIERSKSPPLLNGPVEQLPPEELKNQCPDIDDFDDRRIRAINPKGRRIRSLR